VYYVRVQHDEEGGSTDWAWAIDRPGSLPFHVYLTVHDDPARIDALDLQASLHPLEFNATAPHLTRCGEFCSLSRCIQM
jgi:hypothetical protein